MALDLPIQSEVEVQTTKKITTDKTRVKGTYFDFDNTLAVAFIAFGVDNAGTFEEKKAETWVLSGDYYLSVIGANTASGTMAEELLAKVAEVVTALQSDTKLKTDLIASGELKVVPQDISMVFNQL